MDCTKFDHYRRMFQQVIMTNVCGLHKVCSHLMARSDSFVHQSVEHLSRGLVSHTFLWLRPPYRGGSHYVIVLSECNN